MRGRTKFLFSVLKNNDVFSKAIFLSFFSLDTCRMLRLGKVGRRGFVPSGSRTSLWSPVSFNSLGSACSYSTTAPIPTFAQPHSEEEIKNQLQYPGVLALVNAYRTHGHVSAQVDPLKKRTRRYCLLIRYIYFTKMPPVRSRCST